MYKYGISLYKLDDDLNRTPNSGVDIRLLRPGQTFAEGIVLIEIESTGHYERMFEESDCGFYEIWDNQSDKNGTFTSKTCIVGKLDARGIQDSAIFANHICDGAVTSDKIALNSIQPKHIDSLDLGLKEIAHDVYDAKTGYGAQTLQSPATFEDSTAIHILPGEFGEVPYVILTNWCGCPVFIYSIELRDKQVSVIIGIGKNEIASELAYSLLVFK